MLDRKTILVATREYVSTVLTKAFLFGAVILPILIYGLAVAIPTLIKDDVPQMTGTIAIVDETGKVSGFLKSLLSRQAIEMQKDGLKNLSSEEIKKEVEKKLGSDSFATGFLAAVSVRQIEKLRQLPTPELTFTESTPAEADIDDLKQQVRDGTLLAVVHIKENALALPESRVLAALARGTENKDPATDAPVVEDQAEPKREPAVLLYTEKTLHVENSDFLKAQLGQAVVMRKIIDNRVDPDLLQRVTAPAWVQVVNVTEQGEFKANEIADMFVPFGFMLLLWMSTFTGGQYLLTTTIEEKSSKVIEVLLSATSPMQLMTGKILGQGAVALTMVLLYGALALGGVAQFAGDSVYINPWSIVLVTPYFIMAFFFIACMMAAIGSAVNDMREAQALMGPAMMVLMLPLLGWLPIVRSPDGMFATVTSFIPPLTPFVMALRLGSTQPPGWLQITLTLLIGFAAVWVSIWATAKIFRIGVLMHGKPPNLKTLISWIRQA